MWRVTVDGSCIGSQSCVGIAPRSFALGADNQAHPAHTEVAPDALLLDAAASCPMEAIRVYDLVTGQVIEP
jgi:ferredoxin